MSQADVKNALIEVRKAYRLIADYQQRVLELLEFIRLELGAVSYYAPHTEPNPDRLAKDPQGGKKLLPLEGMSIFWIRHSRQADYIHHHTKGDFLLNVHVENDSAWEQGQQPEDGETNLYFYFYLCLEPKKESNNWYHDVCAQNQANNYDDKKVRPCDNNPGYKMYGEALNLSDFADEASAISALNGLRQRVSEKFDLPVFESAKMP